jgi:hypothetical protein
MRRFHEFAAILSVLFMASLTGLKAGKDEASGVHVDKVKRTVTIDARIAPRKMDDPKFQGKIYPIEVIACWPYPIGQKAHETVVTIEARPSAVHKALVELGLKPGQPVMGESKAPPEGPEVNVLLEVPGVDGQPRRVGIDKTMFDPKTNKTFPRSVKFRFTGSVLSKPDPNKDETVYGADMTGTLIAIFPVTNQTVLQTNLTMEYERFMKLETNPNVVPKVGTPVKLVLEVPAGK